MAIQDQPWLLGLIAKMLILKSTSDSTFFLNYDFLCVITSVKYILSRSHPSGDTFQENQGGGVRLSAFEYCKWTRFLI